MKKVFLQTGETILSAAPPGITGRVKAGERGANRPRPEIFEKITVANLHFSEAVIYLKTSKTENASVAQLVEHHVANVIVAGSIPVTRSN